MYSLLVRLCLLITIINTCYLYAQPPYQFTNYTTANGLSDNRVTCIYKDKTGYMWIGTENGLNRFDGHSFLIYRPGNQRKTLSHAFINDIQQDKNGNLWVATQNGLNRIDLASDTTFVFLPLGLNGAYRNKSNTIPSNLIWSLYIDDQNRVWMAPDMRDLCYYDIRQKKFVHYPWFDYLKKNFPHRDNQYNSIRKIYYKSNDEIWLGTAAGLFSMNTTTGVFTHYPGREADHFIQLVRDTISNAVYYIQQPGSSLQVLRLHTGETQSIPYTSIPNVAINNYENGLWLPAADQLLKINPFNKTYSKIVHEVDNPYSLIAGNLNTVYRDDNGLLWIGGDAGLSKVYPSPGAFHYYPVFDNNAKNRKPDKDLFRKDHLLYSVIYDSAHSKYYLSSPKNNCFLIIDIKTGRKQTVTQVNGIPLKHCSVLYKDRNGMIWIAANRHAFIYNTGNNTFTTTAFQCNAAFMTDMTEDAAGNMWIAGFNDGVYRYSPHNKTTNKLIEDKAYHSDLPTSLYFDEIDQTLWVGTFNTGLYNYNIRTKQFRYFIQSDKQGEINASLITDIVKGKDGKLWLSCYAGGVIVYNSSSGKFTSVTTANGLPDDNVYSLIADGKGKIWGTTYYGLFSIDECSRQITGYGRNRGLNYTDFHSPFILSGKSTIITAVDKGFIHFGSENITLPTGDFPIVINSVKTSQGEMLPAHNNDFRLTFNNNELELEYAALTYYAPELTRYEYKLEGLDESWQQNGKNNHVRYTRLPPGSYTFKVKAIDYSGRISMNEAQVSFTIIPPWWRTTWFLVSLITVLLFAGVYIYKKRIAGIRNKSAIQLQVQELKEQALRTQMNPHFIFNSLNAIQELIVTEDYTSSYRYLSKFSRLMRLVLHASETTLQPLYKEIEINRLYLELEALRFKHSFQYDISVPPEVDIENTMVPTLLLQPFIENAIWHGLLPKKGMKELIIDFSEEEESLICTITDNGIGRAGAMEIKRNKLGNHNAESKGIQMVTQRLKTLELSGNIKGALYIGDLRDAGGNVAGTRVKIILVPFNK